MAKRHYIVTFYGSGDYKNKELVLLVRARNPKEAMRKSKKLHPFNDWNLPAISTMELDIFTSMPNNDVVEIAIK